MIPFNPAVAAEVRALIQGADESTFDPIYRELCQVTLQLLLPSPNPRHAVLCLRDRFARQDGQTIHPLLIPRLETALMVGII